MKNLGYDIGLWGLALVLIWIGLFKFTPTEAKAIEPLISHSPLTKWLYSYLSQRQVSETIGTIEILTGFLLLLSYVTPFAGLIGGFMSVMTFVVTISFIFTTPGGIDKIDGFYLPDAFILKDVMALGISLSIFLNAYAVLMSRQAKLNLAALTP